VCSLPGGVGGQTEGRGGDRGRGREIGWAALCDWRGGGRGVCLVHMQTMHRLHDHMKNV